VKPRHLVTLADWTEEQIRGLLDLAHRLKKQAGQGQLSPTLAGKTLALVFEKSSMRTRVAFEVAMRQLGGGSIYLSRSDIELGKREPVKDGARVLSRYVDAIAARTYSHATVDQLAVHATVPVINALSDRAHPCQALADIMTMQERFPNLAEVTVAYIGDANNVAWSLGIICGKLGIRYRLACPKRYQFDEQTLHEISSIEGARFETTDSAREAASGADVLYTDTWISMGQEGEAQERVREFRPYCIDEALVRAASPGAIVMHCLPAYRGNEITDEVIEGPQSVVFDQAENRLHAQRAVLQALLAG